MNILIVNTYHYLRGGDCRHAFGLGKLLKAAGHEVHYFAMQGPDNLPCPDAKHFVSEIDFRKTMKSGGPVAALKVLSRTIYSKEARRKIAALLDEVKPDIAHLHSIRHHLTKSILSELKERNIPIVWTLHDFKEICPNTSFYDGHNICEKCKGGKYTQVVWNRCKKNSLGASLITYLEARGNSGAKYDGLIDCYISPSRFLVQKFTEHGYDPASFVHIPNFLEIDLFQSANEYRNYLLFIGRLERGKGIETMIQGFGGADCCPPPLTLKIAGEGSLQDDLEKLVRNNNIRNIEFTGFLKEKELDKVARKAKAVIIPSELYENYPFSGLEAMAYGKPVIGSRIGGIPEQVDDGVTGLLFEAFNAEDLSDKINRLNRLTPEEIRRMGAKGREKVEQINSPHQFLSKIQDLYKNLTKR
ncbi:glycosyl transferase [Desulfosarcina ovata subsp. sediminis]|uniref:Glycosyl transferase n=1 Tax=Desulfosarcina ovata subsp. sediminis TaxID=885957 RepID=A0A5K8A0E2_9BACT|nr:glycosyltransferase family 4 protein [Desulfosarcina ovata]BBO85864.1 glycosyl transferase [Desulfosarcina ovata subsp. sediminis]